MIDLKTIISKQEEYIDSLNMRNFNINILDVFKRHNELKEMKSKIELLSQNKNEQSNLIRTQKLQGEDVNLQISHLKVLKDDLVFQEKKYDKLFEQFQQEYTKLPNELSLKDYYFSSGGTKLDSNLDVEKYLKTRGWKKGDTYFDGYITLINLVKRYFNNNYSSKGFVHMRPKTIYEYDQVEKRKELLYSSGYNRFNDNIFIDNGEILLLNAYFDTIVEMDDLPIRNISLINNIFDNSCCARLVSIVKPTDYLKELELYKNQVIKFYEKLNIPFVIQKQDYEQFPLSSYESLVIKLYSPSQKDFIQVGSIDVSKDYLSRRAKLRFKTLKANEFLYSMSCKLFDGKDLIPILIENYIQKNNKIILPEILRFNGIQQEL